LLPKGSVVIASARPLTDVHLRAQIITRSESEARGFVGRLNAFLALFGTIDISMDGGPDPDVKKAFESFTVTQDKNEAVVTANVPFAFFRKMVSESPVELAAPKRPPAEAPQPEAPPTPLKKHK
jgi:hypothetical protein